MKKRGGKNDNTSTKTKGLQQEAADMEVKLLELRKAMEAERVRRENIMSTATNGSLWRNGGNGLLRSNFRNKQSQGATAGAGSPASSAADSPHRAASAPRDPATAAAAAAEARALGIANASPSMRSARSPALDGVRSPAPRFPPDVTVVGSAATTRRPPDVLSVHQPGPAVGGTGCGADDEDISAGAFNEADSHRSFMEALNEWRSAQRAPEPQAAASSSTHVHSSQPGASMEVQTDTSNKAPRPLSATKKSYFEKLALNSASRHAGECATGGGSTSGPPHLEAGSSSRHSSSARSSLSAAAAASASEHGVAAEPSSLEQRLATLDRLEQLEQQRQQEAERGCLDEDDEEEVVVAQTVVSMGLVKGMAMHLPDAILLPDHTSEALVKDD